MTEEKWIEAIRKSLVGKKVTGITYLTESQAEENLWYNRPVVIIFDDGSYIIPLSDDEGNNAGAIFTNIKGFETIPVDRKPVLSKKMKRVYEDVKKQIEKEVKNG